MKTFDLLLAYYYFRHNPYYLNIIKEMSSSFRIGILLNDEQGFYEKRPSMSRAKETDKLYRQACYDMGAEPVLISENVLTRILLLPNEVRRTYFDKSEWHFTDDYISKLKANVSYEKLFGLFFFVSPVEKTEGFEGLVFDRDYAIDKHMFYERAKDLGVFKAVQYLNLKEMGAPYQKYPAFPELSGTIDYLIAFPSAVHYDKPKISLMKEKLVFIKNVMKLLTQIPKGDRVVIKHHNLRDKQRYFVDFGMKNKMLLRMVSWVAEHIAKWVPWLSHKGYSLAANCLHTIVVNTYPSLEELTSYHNFPLQVFVPAIKKGVISGYSTTAFVALSHDIPYYNCDSRSRQEVANAYNDSFQVEPCHGQLFFDPIYFKRVAKEFRDADFIQDLKETLGAACVQEIQ